MANHKHLHGRDILLMYKDADTGNYRTIAGARTADIVMKQDTQEVSSPTTGTWNTYIKMRKSWSISTSGLFSSNSDLLWQLFNKSSELVVTWRDQSIYTNDYGGGDENQRGYGFEYSGACIITSMKLTATNRELCQYSVELDGTGELTCQRWTDEPKRELKIWATLALNSDMSKYYLKTLRVDPPVCDAINVTTNLSTVNIALAAYQDTFVNADQTLYTIDDYSTLTAVISSPKYVGLLEEAIISS